MNTIVNVLYAIDVSIVNRFTLGELRKLTEEGGEREG